MRRRRPNVSFKESFIRGAIGKRFVIKHYKWYIIKTKFPDMTRIIPSPKQVECRNRFRDAVAYAKAEMAHPVAKSQWLKRTKKKWRVFNYIIKTYMRMQAEIKKKQQSLTAKVPQAKGHSSQLRVMHIPKEQWKYVYPVQNRYAPPAFAPPSRDY